jgi:uncharacterized protein
MLIKVKVFPNSKKEEFIIKDRSSFVVKIKEKPIEGKANDSVIDKLASHFNIPSKKFRIIKGSKTRNKIIEIHE